MRVKLTPAFVAKPPLPEPPKDRTIPLGRVASRLRAHGDGQRPRVIRLPVPRRPKVAPHVPEGGPHASGRPAQAKKLLGDVARGSDPLTERRKAAAAAADTFQRIAEEYVQRERANVRSIKNHEATLRKHVFATLGRRPIGEVKRSDIARLLDRIQDGSGPSAADNALRVIRRVMSWHASRSDDFRSPIARGMARTKPKERARQRILADGELRAVWAAAEASGGLFGPFVQFLLLTAARRTEASAMARAELSVDAWTIPGSRYKTKIDHVIPLVDAARSTLDRLPKIAGARFIFSGDGKRSFSGYSKAKAKFDKACGVTGWTLHDLRRTARSLMSRAGVSADIAERCLGHVISGVRGIYDRHAYFDEKETRLRIARRAR